MEAFILKVREYPCLWNSELEEYKDSETKESAWLDIAKAFPQFKDPRQAKYQWKKLRDNHREAIKRKLIGRRGASVQHGHAWKHEKVMEFILPFMNNRLMGPNYNLQMQLSMADETNNQIEDENEIGEDCPEDDPEPNDAFPPNNIEPVIAGNNTIAEDNLISSLDKKLDKRKKKLKIDEDAKKVSAKFNPLDYFFASMCETTKRLPENIQIKIKRKIFQAVMEGEEKKMRKEKGKSSGNNRRAKNTRRSSNSSLSENMLSYESDSNT